MKLGYYFAQAVQGFENINSGCEAFSYRCGIEYPTEFYPLRTITIILLILFLSLLIIQRTVVKSAKMKKVFRIMCGATGIALVLVAIFTVIVVWYWRRVV